MTLTDQDRIKRQIVTVVLQDESFNIASAPYDFDWASQHHLTEPVLGVNGEDSTRSDLWVAFFAYLKAVTLTTDPDMDEFGLGGFGFPLVAVVDPDQGLEVSCAGSLTPSQILGGLGLQLIFTEPPAPTAFSLGAFQLGFSSQSFDPTPLVLYSGSRAEPTSATSFTSGNLPTTLQCNSTNAADTFFRASRSFNFSDLVDNFGSVTVGDALGTPNGQVTLTLSNLQWGDSGPGVLDLGSVYVVVQDSSSGQTGVFPVPFVTQANGPVTIGPFFPYQVIPNPTFATSNLAFPTLVVIDPAGRIESVQQGALSGAELLNILHRNDLTFQNNQPAFTVNGFEADFTYGGQTATYLNATVDQLDTPLAPDQGTAPANLELFRAITRVPRSDTEDLYIGFDLGATAPTTLAHDVPISLTLKNVHFGAAGPGYYTFSYLTVTASDDTTGDTYTGLASLTTSSDPNANPSWSIDSLAAAGVPAGLNVTSLHFTLNWIGEDPDTLLNWLSVHVSNLGLPAKPTSALQVAMQDVLIAYQAHNSPKTAVDALHRFQSLLTPYQLHVTSSLLAQSLQVVTSLAVTKLVAAE